MLLLMELFLFYYVVALVILITDICLPTDVDL